MNHLYLWMKCSSNICCSFEMCVCDSWSGRIDEKLANSALACSAYVISALDAKPMKIGKEISN